MNKENDFVYLVTVVRSTLPLMFGWLYFCKKVTGSKTYLSTLGEKGHLSVSQKYFISIFWDYVGVFDRKKVLL